MLAWQGLCQSRQALPSGVLGVREIARSPVQIGESVEIVTGQEMVRSMHLALDRYGVPDRLDRARLVSLAVVEQAEMRIDLRKPIAVLPEYGALDLKCL